MAGFGFPPGGGDGGDYGNNGDNGDDPKKKNGSPVVGSSDPNAAYTPSGMTPPSNGGQSGGTDEISQSEAFRRQQNIAPDTIGRHSSRTEKRMQGLKDEAAMISAREEQAQPKPPAAISDQQARQFADEMELARQEKRQPNVPEFNEANQAKVDQALADPNFGKGPDPQEAANMQAISEKFRERMAALKKPELDKGQGDNATKEQSQQQAPEKTALQNRGDQRAMERGHTPTIVEHLRQKGEGASVTDKQGNTFRLDGENLTKTDKDGNTSSMNADRAHEVHKAQMEAAAQAEAARKAQEAEAARRVQR